MTTIERQTTVIGLFSERSQAGQALDDLRQDGFRDDQFGFVVRHTQYVEHIPEPVDSAPGAAVGAVGGGVLGGLVGAAVALLIPGFGPAIAGGILGATLGGAALGAATGGFVGAMAVLGLSEEDARYYERALETGHVIVTVQAQDRPQEALTLLQNAGAFEASIHPRSAPLTQEPNKPDQQPASTSQEVSRLDDVFLDPTASSPPTKAYSPDSVSHWEGAADRPSRNNIPVGARP